jgi:hypothetical protein
MEVDRRRELVKESVDEINDAIEAMIRKPRAYLINPYGYIVAIDDADERIRRLTRFAIDIVRVLLGRSYHVANMRKRTTVKTSDVDYVYDLIKRQNYSIGYYRDARSYHKENITGDDEYMTDDEEDEEYADES